MSTAATSKAESRMSPSGKIVYKAILMEGEEELERATAALFWSGLAAGLSMGFSMITEALLTIHLPAGDWRPLVAKFGYSAGFLIVVLGRQQLFTENTLTPILPLLKRKQMSALANVLRLWAVVLVANLIGAALFATVAMKTQLFDEATRNSFLDMGRKAIEGDFGSIVLKAVFAGWLIALMVWLLPFAESARIWVIIFLPYIVGLAEFSHIIAGAVETFTLAVAGTESWTAVFTRFILPALLGNILGGVALVAMLNHAQIVAGEQGEDI